MGKAAAVLGGEKVDRWAAILITFHFFRTHLATHLGEGWLHFSMRMIAFLGGIGYASIADSKVLGGGWLSV